MNRRSFLGLLGMTIGGVALEQAIPNGRVWSFPSEIKIVPINSLLTVEEITAECLQISRRYIKFYNLDESAFRSRLDILHGFGQLETEGEVGSCVGIDWEEDVHV